MANARATATGTHDQPRLLLPRIFKLKRATIRDDHRPDPSWTNI